MKDVYDSDYFRLMKILMKCMGTWPRMTRFRRIFTRLVVIAIVYTIAPLVLLETIRLSKVSIDLVIPSIPPLLTCLLCSVKYLNWFIHIDKFIPLLEDMEKDILMDRKKEHRDILERYWRKGKFLSCFYVELMLDKFIKHETIESQGYILVSLVIYLIVPLAPLVLDVILPMNETRARQLLFPADYGVDMEENWHWCMIHEYVATTCVVNMSLALDALYIIFACHACGLFAITRYRLEQVGDVTVDIQRKILASNKLASCECTGEVAKIFQSRIKACAQQHIEAIRFVTRLEQNCCWSLLIIVTLNGIIVSITGLQIVTRMGHWDEVFNAILYTLAQLVHLFFLSLPGQSLIDESAGIRISGYNSLWYNVPSNERKLLILLLLRSQYPCELSAGKVVILHLETFTTILQTSMSYFTALASLR